MNEVWQVGDVKVTRVVELEVTGGSRFILPDATREAVRDYRWLYPHFMDDAGNLVMSIHALVVDTGERRIVVDTCIGNDKERAIPAWSNLQTSFLADLETAGYPPSTIDTVLCTHLHVDHVGWNTRLVDGEWVPTFPHARYLVGKVEWDYWSGRDADDPVLADSVTPVLDAGLVPRQPSNVASARPQASSPLGGASMAYRAYVERRQQRGWALAGAPFGWSPERPSPRCRRLTYPGTTSRLRLARNTPAITDATLEG